MTASDIAELFRAYKFHYWNEKVLQEAIESLFVDLEIPYEREYRFEDGRVDFLVGRVGIEVKIGGSTSRVERQLKRYAPHFDGLVLVTTRLRHKFPDEIGGKPLETVCPALDAL